VKNNRCRRQQGAALLVFLLVALTMAGSFGLAALNKALSNSTVTTDYQVLQQAKEALVGYALAYGDTHANNLPGYLPCPDSNGDGDAELSCGNVNETALGFLPWRSLGLAPLRDSSGSCLWYAVSGAYKASPQGNLSTDAGAQLLLFDAALTSLNGLNNSEAGIAIIFAPGRAVLAQTRSVTAAAATQCGSNVSSQGIRQAQNYLESWMGVNNAAGSYSGSLSGVPITPVPSLGFSAFISAPVQDTFNDVVVLMRPSDFQTVYHRMQQWVGERVRQCLLAYQGSNGGKLPWPAILDPLAAPSYNDNDQAKRFGRIPANLTNTAAAGLSASWPFDPQQPASQCFAWSWWPNFSESAFYGIDLSVAPTGVSAAPVLSVDAAATSGAVLIAGRRLGLQARSISADKGLIGNYLETGNLVDAGLALIPPGDEAFISVDNSGASFNDYVCTLSACP
jgi:hypothetical protein